jgi:hypothetical protein
MEFGEGKNILIKHHIPRDVDSTGGGIKELETFMTITITQEDTLFRFEGKLSWIVGA